MVSWNQAGPEHNFKSCLVAPSMYQGYYSERADKNPSFMFGSSDGKEQACNAGDLGSILGSGRSPGEGNGYPLWYSHLGNPLDRGARCSIVHRVTEFDTTEWLTRNLCFSGEGKAGGRKVRKKWTSKYMQQENIMGQECQSKSWNFTNNEFFFFNSGEIS